MLKNSVRRRILRFRDYQVAAPLKPDVFADVDASWQQFPRLSSRGPIEAARDKGRFRLFFEFPRLSSRGPIEAERQTAFATA